MLRKNIWKLLFHSQDLLHWIINRSCRWTTLSNNKVCLHFILSSNPWNSKSRKDNSALPQLSSSVFGEYSSWLKIAANWRWLFPSYFCSSFKTEEAFQHLVCVCVCVYIYIHIREVKWSESGSVVSYSLRFHGLKPARLLCPWNSPGRNTGVGCCSLLQGSFLTQELNLGLPHCRQILYHLSHRGNPI